MHADMCVPTHVFMYVQVYGLENRLHQHQNLHQQPLQDHHRDNTIHMRHDDVTADRQDGRGVPPSLSLALDARGSGLQAANLPAGGHSVNWLLESLRSAGYADTRDTRDTRDTSAGTQAGTGALYLVGGTGGGGACGETSGDGWLGVGAVRGGGWAAE